MRRAMIGVAALLLVAACGGGSDDGRPGTTPATEQPAAETPATTVETVDVGLDEIEGDLNGCGVPDRDLNPDGTCPS